MKIVIKKDEVDYGDKGVPLRVADDIIEGLKVIEQHEKGEITLPTWNDMMSELRAGEVAIA